jgi:hypothetical protein
VCDKAFYLTGDYRFARTPLDDRRNARECFLFVEKSKELLKREFFRWRFDREYMMHCIHAHSILNGNIPLSSGIQLAVNSKPALQRKLYRSGLRGTVEFGQP